MPQTQNVSRPKPHLTGGQRKSAIKAKGKDNGKGAAAFVDRPIVSL